MAALAAVNAVATVANGEQLTAWVYRMLERRRRKNPDVGCGERSSGSLERTSLRVGGSPARLVPSPGPDVFAEPG